MRLKSNLIIRIFKKAEIWGKHLLVCVTKPLHSCSKPKLNKFSWEAQYKIFSDNLIWRCEGLKPGKGVFLKGMLFLVQVDTLGQTEVPQGAILQLILCQTKKSDKIIKKVPSGLKIYEFIIHLISFL